MHTWPPASAHIDTDATGTITLAGISRTLTANTIDDARTLARNQLAAWATHLGRPLTACVTDPTGTWTITVDADADTQDVATPSRRSWWKK